MVDLVIQDGEALESCGAARREEVVQPERRREGAAMIAEDGAGRKQQRAERRAERTRAAQQSQQRTRARHERQEWHVRRGGVAAGKLSGQASVLTMDIRHKDFQDSWAPRVVLVPKAGPNSRQRRPRSCASGFPSASDSRHPGFSSWHSGFQTHESLAPVLTFR